MKETLNGLPFADMEFVPKQDTETDPDAIKKIKAFQEKLAFNGLSRFRQSLQKRNR